VNIDPGDGYRLLRNGEIVIGTDEIFSGNIGPWRICRDSVGNEWNSKEWCAVRRKLTDEEQYRKPVRLYTTCDDLGVINGAVVYATERDVANDNVREIKVDPSTGTLYVEDGHGRPTGEA